MGQAGWGSRRRERPVSKYVVLFFSHLSLAAKPFDDSIQDGVLDDVLVGPFSSPRNGQLGDYSGQTQGGVVSQRHVADL